MLLGTDDGFGSSPDIQPNSQYDQSITFEDDSEPGAYSPRPDPSEPMPDFQQFQSIGKQSFFGCKNLKNITVKSKKLKKVGAKAIKGINKKATIKCPNKSYVKKYKKLFGKKAGFTKTMKIK